jgi:hypothetical protein
MIEDRQIEEDKPLTAKRLCVALRDAERVERRNLWWAQVVQCRVNVPPVETAGGDNINKGRPVWLASHCRTHVMPFFSSSSETGSLWNVLWCGCLSLASFTPSCSATKPLPISYIGVMHGSVLSYPGQFGPAHLDLGNSGDRLEIRVEDRLLLAAGLVVSMAIGLGCRVEGLVSRETVSLRPAANSLREVSRSAGAAAGSSGQAEASEDRLPPSPWSPLLSDGSAP